MTEGLGGTVAAASAPARPVATPPQKPPVRRRRPQRLWLDLTIIGVVLVLVLVAAAAALGAIQREFYSPSAFVERYLQLLSEGRASEALAVPGVAVESAELEAAGLPANADEALLRRAALASLTDVRTVSETRDGETARVTVEYRAGAHAGTTTFHIERDGTVVLAPTWRFATSPLAVMNLTVIGSPSFEVNGFEIDKRQVSPEGADADPLAPLSLLVFSPGIYSVSVDTAVAATPGVAVLSDSPFSVVPVTVSAQPTPEFESLVQQRVEEFLTDCATQAVLQPTACPFGFVEQDRVVSAPVWSIVQQPTVTLESEGAGWKIPATDAVAHIEFEVQSLFDGSLGFVSEDVPFVVTGGITFLPDGSASIVVGGPDTF